MTASSQPTIPADAAKSQRLELLDRLAGGVAHEFNNVLQIVRGYVTFARDSLPDGSKAYGDLVNALRATDRAAELSARLLQFARVDEPGESEADGIDAVEALRLLLRPIIGEKIDLIVTHDGGPIQVAASGSGLRQTLLNLCVNARDAMPDGGELRVEASSADNADGEPGLAFDVSDTGTGMDAETLARCTELFFTRKAHGEGTGLGLAMVREFVDRSGGDLAIESTVDVGSRFRLWLPLAGSPEAESAAVCDDVFDDVSTDVGAIA